MGKNSYHFMQEQWSEVFGITVLSHEATPYGHSFHADFDMGSYLNSCPKAPQPEDNLVKVSTGYLKRNQRILHWIVTYVLHQRKYIHSRIDIDEVHLMYILQNKIKIKWPNYFVLRMFVVKDCNRESSLCYVSMIAKILRHFRIGVVNLQSISPGQAQEFN